ncbi:site-specific DNA-methyltransferase [Treponema endosymbiont of Eucomonympha sp.]|uniref:site-specific DNA-methyltransferase n=2 Tax=Treponema endosymbiont of Eucomonympha sp. TaxID=1580831 RepID=UPI000784D783|nr:DNA methyltransferase [Treponema endosymbiont of Eucomonympha sp.]
MSINRLILGDNLEILKTIEADSVDLIYLDPPFFSNRNYEVIWGDAGEVRSFQDRWAGGISHYIDWLKERVEEMHRILKPTGSIFLHCDWHANAYIRVFVLDKVFGEDGFINEFVWKRSSTRSSISKAARKNYDTIFYYAKSKNHIYNQVFMGLSQASKDLYKNKDEKGVYQTVPLLVSGKRNGETGKVWKNIDPNKHGKEGMHWVTTPDKLDEYDRQGLVYFPPKGVTPRLKYYSNQSPGVPLSEIWDDILLVQRHEAIGYPTQKPEALLERIIKMASNEGDTVFDPFAGGGTTIAVADRLNRRWLGVDQSVQAIKVTEFRLQKQTDLFTAPYTVQLHKYDYDMLRYKDAFEFESWIIAQCGGTPQNKKGGDKGIDGKAADGTPIQVKRSDTVGVNVIKNFSVSAKQFDKSLFEQNAAALKPVGTIIAFSFGRGAIEETSRLKNEERILIRLLRVEEIVPVAVKPAISVHISEMEQDEKGTRKIAFAAAGQSPAGIEFYSWDFMYDAEKGFKPQVLLDKTGTQTCSFKTGSHTIAIKVVDNDGLENTEVIRLKINGKVEQVT